MGDPKMASSGVYIIVLFPRQGTGAFDSWGFAHTSSSSQTSGNPNTPLGDTGGDIWSGQGPGFEDVTLLGQQLPSNFEELSGWFDQVPDVLARPPCGSTNHSPVGQPESHPVPPPPLDSEVPCAKSYNEGFKDALTMILAALQVQAPPTQSNPMAVNETQASHHPPPPFALPQEGQTGVGFPPDCPRPNARSTIPPLVNNLPQGSFPTTTQSPYQVLLDPDANLAWNVELSRLAPNSQPRCFETDRGQSAHQTQLAPPTSADLTPAPVPPFSPERQPSGVVRSTAERVTRQHICAHCSKSYRKPYQLRDHIKCKHEGGVKSYCCGHDGCGKTFTTRSNLVRHVKKEHQAGNVSQRNEGHASEARNEPARAAGRSTRRRRASDPFVVCTPDVMHYK